jgi:integrase
MVTGKLTGTLSRVAALNSHRPTASTAKSSNVGSRDLTTLQQFNNLVQLIAEPYATMVYFPVWTGLRVRELIGLRWKNVHVDSITIDERRCRGDWGNEISLAANSIRVIGAVTLA